MASEAPEKRKKICITILRGWLARNFLHNDFYRILRERYDIVILTPAWKDERFVKEFGHPHVRFVAYDEIEWSFADRIMTNLHRLLIWNRSVELHLRYGVGLLDKGQSAPIFYLTKLVFHPLSKLRFLRTLVRRFDEHFFQRRPVADLTALLERERPDLVIATHPTGDIDAALIKAAKHLGIRAWAMPKSWDNLSKSSFRAKADKLIVWSRYMKEKAVVYQGYRPEEIAVIGVLHYDIFNDTGRIVPYKEFCEAFGLDPDRKTIFYGSEGKLIPTDKDITTILYEMIEHGELKDSCQLLIRPHYGHKNDEKKFEHLLGKAHVAIDMFNRKSHTFKDEWDYSEEFTNRWLNSLHHASVIVNVRSSLTMDAAALNRPAVNVMFDGFETHVPYQRSLARMYAYDYYAELLETGGATIVRSREEFRDAVNAYLKDPARDAPGRARLVEKYSHRVDGKTGERFAALVSATLDNSSAGIV